MELEFRVFLGGGEYPEKILVKLGRERTLISSSHNCQYKLRPFMTIELLIRPFFPKYGGTLI